MKENKINVKWGYPIIALAVIFLLIAAATPSIYVRVNSTGTVLSPTNFFTVNSNLLLNVPGIGDTNAWLADVRARTSDLTMGGYDVLELAALTLTNLNVEGVVQLDEGRFESLIVTNAIDGVTITNAPYLHTLDGIVLTELAASDLYQGTNATLTELSLLSPDDGKAIGWNGSVLTNIAGGGSMSWDIDIESTTANETPVAIYTNVIAPSTTVSFEVTARAAGATNAGRWKMEGQWRRTGDAGATLVGKQNTSTNYTLAGMDVEWALSGDSNVVATVTGAASENLNWYLSGFLWADANGYAAGADPVSYLVQQGFEGTGYDNDETWVSTGTGTVDPDYAANPLVGSQSLQLVTSAQPGAAYIEFDARSDSFGFFRYRLDSGSAATVASFRNGSTAVAVMSVVGGKLRVLAAGGSNNDSAGNFPTETDVYVWFEYEAGSGLDAVARAGWSEYGTKPSLTAGGAASAVSNDGTGLGTFTRFYLGTTGSGTSSVVYDHVRMLGTAIGNSPE